jgi:hypothetical protein
MDNMLHHGKQMQVGILLYSITLLLLIVVLLMNGVVGHFYNKTSKAFQKNLSNIGYIYYDGEIEASSQEKKNLLKRLNNLIV